MSTTVRFDDPRATTAVGVVEILSADMSPVSAVPLVGTGVAVHSLEPGRYLAMAHLVDGPRTSVMFTVPDDLEVVVPVPASAGPPPKYATGWASVWSGADEVPIKWTRTEEGIDFLPHQDRAGHSALQYALGDDATRFTMLLPAAAVRPRLDPDVGYVLEPASDAAAIMRFLRRGDLPSAGTLARKPPDTADPATVLAVGYYRQHVSEPKALYEWFGPLETVIPRDVCDLWLLNAWFNLTTSTDSERARQSLLNAADLGPPVFAAGLRIFDDALRVLTYRDRDGALEKARVKLTPYRHAAFDTAVLTTFWGHDPLSPTLEPVNPSPDTPPSRYRFPIAVEGHDLHAG